MIKWMKEMWDFPRSLTGHGTRSTLGFLQNINSDLKIHSYNSGKKVFDWEIPDEWNIYDAFIEHESGRRFAEFTKNNLHVLNYSSPFNKTLELSELLPNIITDKEQPEVIPYVTSYYSDRWGFCMSEKEKNKLPAGQYKVVIDATKGPGTLELADLIIQGKSNKEIFFSTYVCHPSMANNELSGPVLSSALAQYLKSKYSNPNYTYRFVFAPETIGAITYLSQHFKVLKERVICGFNLSCVGDDRAFSHIESRLGNTLADDALKAALIGLDNVETYSYLHRGSDERQYCSPGIDLPFCGFCRTKYGSYKEYHTSADNFDVVTSKGLESSFNVIKSIIDAFELNLYPKVNTYCEPQLGKRNLYPTLGTKKTGADVDLRMNIIAYSDGKHSLFDISNKVNKNLGEIIKEVQLLESNKLLSLLHSPIV